jgi:hypothetical protein
MLEKIIFSEKNTPVVSLDPNGMITIKGRSLGGNLYSFLRQIDEWVDEYISAPADLTCVDVYLEYLKGIDLKIYISLLRKISSVRLKNKKCVINWYYEDGDDDILDAGECISLVLKHPFNFIKISDPILNQA